MYNGTDEKKMCSKQIIDLLVESLALDLQSNEWYDHEMVSCRRVWMEMTIEWAVHRGRWGR